MDMVHIEPREEDAASLSIYPLYLRQTVTCALLVCVLPRSLFFMGAGLRETQTRRRGRCSYGSQKAAAETGIAQRCARFADP